MGKSKLSGNLLAAGAYLTWGILPLYWMLLGSVQPLIIVAFRVLFSILFLSVILFFPMQRGEIKTVFRSKKLILMFIASTVAIFLNWTMFIWGVSMGWHLDVSFGYFMTPLFQVVLGVLFLKEKADAGTVVSFALALAAIAYMMIAQGVFPWFSVALSSLFAVYGLVKKKISTDAFAGLYIETLFMMPISAGILIYYAQAGPIPFGQDPLVTVLLVLTGIATTVPMLLYNLAAKKLTMITLGFYQYISPISMFLIGVLITHDGVKPYQIVSFSMIWAALIIFTTASVIKWRKKIATETM